MLLDALDFQRQAVAQALDPARLRPRMLIADAVGLGKTLEIGMILAELVRRGRASGSWSSRRGTCWSRCSTSCGPGSRCRSSGWTPPASSGSARSCPATRNPFTYFPKVIISIDTLKSARYRAHLEKHRWDAVVIDESHNLTNAGTQNNQLARLLAPNTRGADPGLGDPAQRQGGVVRRADPAAGPDGDRRPVRLRHAGHRATCSSGGTGTRPTSPARSGHMWAERPEPERPR